MVVIAVLEIWKRLVPARSKLVKKIEIALVILAFVGGVTQLIKQAVSPSVEEQIKEAVNTIFEKGTVPVDELKDAYEEIGKLKAEVTRATRRVAELERQGVKGAEGVIEELQKSGDVSRLLAVLEKDRDVHKDELIQRNREIAAVAYLKGDIEKAREAVEEILKLKPDDLYALSQRGNIHRLRGKLKEAESDYNRVLELATETGNNRDRAAALNNLGLVYFTRGDLDKAEEMHLKSLEIDKKLGWKVGMADS